MPKGLVKAKKYDWKDSNLALFGSKLEKDVKKASAATEKAWAPVKSTPAPHTFIWRIVKFVPVPWPKEDYGKFYTGDSYIILNKYKIEGEDEIKYDAHFWIGSYSSQDEYGTAAYKTVELDTFLDDAAIQHREVQNHESDLFKSYFNELTFMEGGADSGFRHVKPEEYKPRLIRIVGEKGKVIAREVPFTRKSLNSDDCFVVDFGKDLHQLNGKKAIMDEKKKAMTYVNKLREEHGSAKVHVTDEGSADHRDMEDFFKLLPDEDISDDDEPDDADECKILYKVSDASGGIQVTKIGEGNLNTGMLKHEDVFIIDTGKELVVWTGKGATRKEIQWSIQHGHNFLKGKKNPLRPISIVKDGKEDKDFYKKLM